MQKTAYQEGYHQLIHLSDYLIQSMNELNIDELQKKVTEYTEKMENYFLAFKVDSSIENNTDELKELMHVHANVTHLFNNKKVQLSEKLKNLHAGKIMQSTYPDK